MKSRARKKKMPSRKKTVAKHSSNTPAAAAAVPRPRRKLPEAMRAVGFDENVVADVFYALVKRLHSGRRSKRPEKLLLDAMKESFRIFYPPTRGGAASDQPGTVELVHFVPRPERTEEKPPGSGSGPGPGSAA